MCQSFLVGVGEMGSVSEPDDPVALISIAVCFFSGDIAHVMAMQVHEQFQSKC